MENENFVIKTWKWFANNRIREANLTNYRSTKSSTNMEREGKRIGKQHLENERKKTETKAELDWKYLDSART